MSLDWATSCRTLAQDKNYVGQAWLLHHKRVAEAAAVKSVKLHNG